MIPVIYSRVTLIMEVSRVTPPFASDTKSDSSISAPSESWPEFWPSSSDEMDEMPSFSEVRCFFCTLVGCFLIAFELAEMGCMMSSSLLDYSVVCMVAGVFSSNLLGFLEGFFTEEVVAALPSIGARIFIK